MPRIDWTGNLSIKSEYILSVALTSAQMKRFVRTTSSVSGDSGDGEVTLGTLVDYNFLRS